MKNIYFSKFQLALGAWLGVTLATSAKADLFHYNNILVGDRAMGLGGAYTAISDDASGLVYNPAGLAFALSNDISGSANAIYRRTVVYKGTFGDTDFEENSEGTFPSFFGGMRKLEDISPGLAFAFGIWSGDSELKDQNDNVPSGTQFTDNGTTVTLARYHRSVNLRSSTSFYGAAVAKRIGNSLGIGLGLSVFQIEELYQDYQDVVSTTDGVTYLTRAQALRSQLKGMGLQPTLGLQWAVSPRVSLGLTVKMATLLQQSLKIDIDRTDAEGASIPSYPNKTALNVTKIAASQDYSKPLGTWPTEARLGAAVFATTRLLISADYIYHSATKGAEYSVYTKKAVTDYATGVEYYVIPSLPVRLGAFTNNDSRPQVDESLTDQSDHIDYLGESIFIAWVQQNSQISGGFVFQQGSGKAQKRAGTTATQPIVASSRTFAFSATHNF